MYDRKAQDSTRFAVRSRCVTAKRRNEFGKRRKECRRCYYVVLCVKERMKERQARHATSRRGLGSKEVQKQEIAMGNGQGARRQ